MRFQLKKALQFLDLNIRLETSHLCWAYEPRTKKSLLSYESTHSKVVKRAIAKSCLRASLLKSCVHRSFNSFLCQVDRLTKAGFPKLVIAGVAESLLKLSRNPLNILDNVRQKHASRPVVIPYLHSFSHRIKKVAVKYGVPIVFSAPSKLSRLCASIERAGLQRVGCGINHRIKYVACAVGVVYKIPFSCGKVYIGQTGRCINVRAREHYLSLRSSPSGHLAIHCDRCGCSPRLSDIEILAKHSQKMAREIHEAFYIRQHGPDLCVSSESVTLYSEEFEFLRSLGTSL